jgi:hypothetical protein
LAFGLAFASAPAHEAGEGRLEFWSMGRGLSTHVPMHPLELSRKVQRICMNNAISPFAPAILRTSARLTFCFVDRRSGWYQGWKIPSLSHGLSQIKCRGPLIGHRFYCGDRSGRLSSCFSLALWASYDTVLHGIRGLLDPTLGGRISGERGMNLLSPKVRLGRGLNVSGLVSGPGLNVSARATSGRRRKSMAPIFIAGAWWVFTPGCLSHFKVRADGS